MLVRMGRGLLSLRWWHDTLGLWNLLSFLLLLKDQRVRLRLGFICCREHDDIPEGAAGGWVGDGDGVLVLKWRRTKITPKGRDRQRQSVRKSWNMERGGHTRVSFQRGNR